MMVPSAYLYYVSTTIAAFLLSTSVSGEDDGLLSTIKRNSGSQRWSRRNSLSSGRQYMSLRHALESNADLSSPVTSTLFDGDVLPWTCNCRHFWRDLGDGYFPRFIQDGACRKSTCWFGHFECIPQVYEISVLKRIDDADFDRPDFWSQQFGQEYILTNINITVNCMCGRAES